MTPAKKWARTPSHVGTTLHAKALALGQRRNMTDPERKLWRSLRKDLLEDGSHFRRQVAIGPYVADFLHLGARLVVEVDGNQHGFEKQLKHDEKRDAYLAGIGFRVLRFSNHEVVTAMRSVIDTIFAALHSSPPTPYPSPQGGGESQASRSLSQLPSLSGDVS
jgi:very-short-patch-repair endonuclease